MADTLDGLEFDIKLNTYDLKAELTSLNNLGKSFGRTIVNSFADGIINGKKFSEVMRSMLLSLSDSALTAALNPLGDALGSAFTSIFLGVLGSANGNVFSGGRIQPFANGGIVNSPTLFPMRGATGLMGEAGPEAIMPLSRGADGKLGIKAQGAANPINITMNITTPDVAGFARSRSQIAASMARAMSAGSRIR